MNPTHDQEFTTPEPRQPVRGAILDLGDLLSDGDRFCSTVSAIQFGTSNESGMDAQDGYVLTENGMQALSQLEPVATPDEQGPGTAGHVLRNAALYLERHGWIQGAYYDATSTVFTPAACLVGAIGMVCYGGPVDAPAQHFDDPGFLDFEEAVLHLDRYLRVEDGSESYEFNDSKGRNVRQVTRVLRDAATRPAEELIDAIRAIDAYNADMVARMTAPGDSWGMRVGDVEHDDNGDVSPTDCRFCSAPGGCPYCHDVVAALGAELAAQDGDVR